MEELNESNEGQLMAKRPKFLLVISILSFVNIGVSILTTILAMISGKPNADELEAAKLQFASSQDQLATLAQSEKVDMSYWSDILTKLEIMTNNMYANFIAYNDKKKAKFKLVCAAATGANSTLTDSKDNKNINFDIEENKWLHYNEFVFIKD